jgi:hypothetical protein
LPPWDGLTAATSMFRPFDLTDRHVRYNRFLPDGLQNGCDYQ